MKIQGRVILVTVFLAGLGGLWLADYYRVPDQEKRRLMEPRVLPELIDTRPDDLRRIEILGGSEPISLQREEDGSQGWRLTLPINASADPSLVENLALNLKTLAKSRDAGGLPSTDAAKYGLAPAARTIKLWGTSGDAPLATLEVGMQVRDRRYVHNVKSSAIDVVDSQNLSALELSPKAWRDRAIFHMPTFQVESIETSRKEGSVTLKRSGEDWRIVKPWDAPAEASTVENILAALASLRVLTGDAGFVAHQVKDFAPYGLDQPELTVTLRGLGGRGEGRVEIGKSAPRPADSKLPPEADLRFARRGGQSDVLVVDARPFIGIGKTPAEFRGKYVGRVQYPRVDYVTVTQEGNEVALARSARGWARVRPSADEADSPAVVRLIRAVSDLQAAELIPPGSKINTGLDKPTAIIRLWEDSAPKRADNATPAEAPKVTLKIGRRDVTKKSVYVQAGDEPNILAVPDSIMTVLPKGPLAFRSRQILALASNLVDRFAIEGGPIRYVLQAPAKPSPNGWKITVPKEAPVDKESLGRLLLLMNNLRAESFISLEAQDPKLHGLDKPWRTLSWTLRPDPGRGSEAVTEVSLVVGKIADAALGTRYAKLTSSPAVFTLGPEQVATLDAEWRDRLVLAADMSRVRSLRLKWRNGIDQTLEPIDDRASNTREWVVTRPLATLGMDTKSVPQILSALSKVQAVRFLQFEGPIPAATGLDQPKLEVEIHEHPALPPKRLKIGGYSSDGYLLATNAEGNEGPIFLLPIGSWEPLTKAPKLDVDLPNRLP